MLNYVTNRFEQFSSEIKQTANMPLINEIIQSPPIILNSELTSINKLAEESLAQTIASKQSVDIKKYLKKIFQSNLIRLLFFINKIIISISNKSFSYAFIYINGIT